MNKSYFDIPAVILVGGLGTRLRSVIGETPKPMVEVDGKPFLEYMIRSLVSQGIKKVILCVGYKNEYIIDYFKNWKSVDVDIAFSVEKSLLGTAGAVKNAERFISIYDSFLLLNGDSYIEVDLEKYYEFHKNEASSLSLLLTKSDDVKRFGSVQLDENDRIISFVEKASNDVEICNINAGVYIMKVSLLGLIPTAETYSLEYDLIPSLLQQGERVYGFKSNKELIDIGTPESLEYFKKNISRFF